VICRCRATFMLTRVDESAVNTHESKRESHEDRF
jgi:hypothetical protein